MAHLSCLISQSQLTFPCTVALQWVQPVPPDDSQQHLPAERRQRINKSQVAAVKKRTKSFPVSDIQATHGIFSVISSQSCSHLSFLEMWVLLNKSSCKSILYYKWFCNRVRMRKKKHNLLFSSSHRLPRIASCSTLHTSLK